MGTPTELERARTAFAGRRWTEAVAAYRAVDSSSEPLDGDALDELATAIELVGRSAEAVEVLGLAHAAHLREGRADLAARSAVWISLVSMMTGDQSRAMGWLARAQRLVADMDEPGVAAAHVLMPEALATLYSGDAARARVLFERLGEIARRCGGDSDLEALSTLGTGQALIMSGEFDAGLRLFDESMAAVTGGEVGPISSGIVYCAVIGYCHLAFDLRRAIEWTRALEHWCMGQPALVAFSGQCHVHRAQVHLLHGSWDAALSAAKLAEERFLGGDDGASFGAFYEQAEVHRLRGEFGDAEVLYRRAAESGWDPQPGLALLRLAEGRPKLAQSLMRRRLEGIDPANRRQLLPALVEIELAAGDVEAAEAATAELREIGGAGPSPMLRALVAQADGAVRLARGDHAGAYASLRTSCEAWGSLGAPYETARCRVLMARARQALGEDEAAVDELEIARAAFAGLGAAAAIAEVASPTEGTPAPSHDAPLSARELEVLRLLATGMTNRGIADELVLSEKTVARHLSNIFAKLGVPTRAAATAYAFTHGLAVTQG